MKPLVCVLALWVLPGAGHPQELPGALEAPAAKPAPKPSVGKTLDNSERQKDCRATAAKALKDIGQKDRVTWSAHYSPRYERCFMELTFHQTITLPDNRVLGRVWIQRLDDLREHRQIAFSQTTDGYTYGIKPEGWIPSKHLVTPVEAQQFIDEMMAR